MKVRKTDYEGISDLLFSLRIEQNFFSVFFSMMKHGSCSSWFVNSALEGSGDQWYNSLILRFSYGFVAFMPLFQSVFFFTLIST
jgi:hypothetical protein